MDEVDWTSIAALFISAATFLWNIIDKKNSYKKDKIRQAYIEFRSLKAPIDNQLINLRKFSRRIEALAMFSDKEDEFIQYLKTVNIELTDAFQDIIVLLEDLDSSPHSDSNDWTVEANDKWDIVTSSIDSLYTRKRESDLRKSLEIACKRITELADFIKARLERELEQKNG